MNVKVVGFHLLFCVFTEKILLCFHQLTFSPSLSLSLFLLSHFSLSLQWSPCLQSNTHLLKMVSGETILLTAPLSLDGESDVTYRAPNLIRRIVSLFKNVRPGSDLTRFQLPPLFNMPKSQLQCYGETVYCVANDMLSRCSKAESSLERFASVVAWSISTTRPLIFGVAPFNPILGETHHVSKGTLNVLLEQVSHHPPVSALHATDEKENIEMIWCQYPVPKFYGTFTITWEHST